MKSSFNPYIDDRTHDLLMAVRAGATMEEAMRDITRAHAAHLEDLGEVGVLALDPCPRCMGRVIAEVGGDEAHCASGCGWSYRRIAADPVASRKASTC